MPVFLLPILAQGLFGTGFRGGDGLGLDVCCGCGGWCKLWMDGTVSVVGDGEGFVQGLSKQENTQHKEKDAVISFVN